MCENTPEEAGKGKNLGCCDRFELHAQTRSLTLKLFEPVSVLLGFIGLDTGVIVGGLVFEHEVDDPCEFVSGGDIGLHDTFASAHPAVVSAESRLAVRERPGRIAESLSCAVFVLFGVAFVDLAAGDVVVRAKSEPGSEVFDGGPAVHIEADLSDDGLSGKDMDAVDGSEIDAGDLVEVRAEVEGRFVARATASVFRFG